MITVFVIALVFFVIWVSLLARASRKIKKLTVETDVDDKDINSKLEDICNGISSLKSKLEGAEKEAESLKKTIDEQDKKITEQNKRIDDLSNELEKKSAASKEDKEAKKKNWIEEFNELLTCSNDQEIVNFLKTNFAETKNVDYNLTETKEFEFPMQIVKVKNEQGYKVIPYIPFIRDKHLFKRDFNKFQEFFDREMVKGSDFGFLKLVRAAEVEKSSGRWVIRKKGEVQYIDYAEQSQVSSQSDIPKKKVTRDEKPRFQSELTLENRVIEAYNEALHSDVTHQIFFEIDKDKASLIQTADSQIQLVEVSNSKQYDFLIFVNSLLFPAFHSIKNNNKILMTCFEIEGSLSSESTEPVWQLVKYGQVEPKNTDREEKTWVLKEKGVLRIVRNR